jgi:hypothetical protein
MGATLSQLELLDHLGRSHRPLRDDCLDRTQTVLLRAALSELQRSESLPASPFHLSLSQTFSGSLRMLRVCSTTIFFRVALSELQRSKSLPASPLHLSLSQTFSGSLRMLRVCSTTVFFRVALSELQRSESATSLQNP